MAAELEFKMKLPKDGIIVTSIESTVTVTAPKGKSHEVKNRDSYGLSFCIEGQITYTLDGEDYVSDRTCAVILPKGRSYSLHHDKNGVFPLINFQCARHLCDKHVLIPIDNPEPYLKDYEMIRQLSLFDGNRMKIMSIFYGMLHRLTSHSSSDILTPAIKYIESNYRLPNLCNEELAKQCHISEVYLRKLFSEIMGVSPMVYARELRINRAMEMLRSDYVSLTDVALSLGYPNLYDFSRDFKRHAGVPPSKYK